MTARESDIFITFLQIVIIISRLFAFIYLRESDDTLYTLMRIFVILSRLREYLIIYFHVDIYLMEARGGGMRRGDKQRLACLEVLWTTFIGEHTQVELTPVATDDKEVCEGDAFPLCRLPE